jgi:Polysaccharide deacetylase
VLTLLYHNVLCAPADDLPVARKQVTIETFRRHLYRFRKNLLHPSKVHDQLTRGQIPRGVLISFDDGAAGIIEAGQALAETGAVGIAFICPGAVKKGLWFYQLADALARTMVSRLQWSGFDLPVTLPSEKREAYGVLSRELFHLPAVSRDACLTEIKSVLQIPPAKPVPPLATLDEDTLCRAANTDGLIFANHSWSHPNLVKLPFAELEYEVEAAQAWLEASGLPVLPWFAFPRGNHDARVRKMVARYCAVSFGASAYEHEADVQPRTYICELDANPIRFIAKTAWEGRLRRRFLSFGNKQVRALPQLVRKENR